MQESWDYKAGTREPEMNKDHDRISEAAKRDLDRLRHEGETLGGTAMNQATKQAESQHQGHSDPEDSIERLGKNIGRILAFVALPVAFWYFGKSAGWW
jgi:hypothetical protein